MHSLTVQLAGTFTPTAEMGADAQRANELAAQLVAGAHAQGRLRAEIVTADVGQVLEACAAIRVPDPQRTAELRRRLLEIILAGLSAAGDEPLPGPPPQPGEANWRWSRRPA